MARQVDIAVSLYDKPVITSLDRLIKKMEELNKAKEKVAPKGKIKFDIDYGKSAVNTSALAKQLNSLAISVKSLDGAFAKMKGVKKIAKETSGASEEILKAEKSVNKLNGTATSTATSIVGLQIALTTAIRYGGMLTKEIMSLTNNTYGVGVASQMTALQISNLNDKFLELSKGTPISAKDLAKATDDLVRTGRTFAEASVMMSEISKLSVASGEPLKDTAQVATKIMVSLGIEASRTKETLTALHSVAIQTASSMGGLAESFKQFAGTLGMYATTTAKNGEELQKYKQDILELGLSATGVLNNLGLSAGFQQVA